MPIKTQKRQISFFQPKGHNLSVLRKSTFQEFCGAIPNFSEMLASFKQDAMFTEHKNIEYTFADFLKSISFDETLLNATAVELINQISFPMLPDRKDTLDVLEKFKEKINSYINIISDILDNRLAQRQYEVGVPDQENVSEKIHALQAAKISTVFNLPLDDVLAMLFHDISRATHEDQEHGHRFHCKEGSVIAAPLGLSSDYCLHHAFAKYLLNQFCQSYREKLMSPVSSQSLAIQKNNFTEILNELNKLSSHQLSDYFFQIMLLRLIDDMSKVPVSEIQSNELIYFSKDQIKILVQIQIEKNFLTLHQDEFDDYETKLDNALALMYRAKEYSENSGLYYTNSSFLLRKIMS